MALIHLQALDGPDRGLRYGNLPTPVTIGREEGNSVRLNDDRVSRFHLKVQEDQGHLVLTDLDSTNGTRVNGESVQICLLRAGDQIRIGGTLLVLGSAEEILERIKIARAEAARSAQERTAAQTGMVSPPELSRDPTAPRKPTKYEKLTGTLLNFMRDRGPSAGGVEALAALPWQEGLPTLPGPLSPAQAAQLCELLAFVHRRLRSVIDGLETDENNHTLRASLEAWQHVLSLEMDLACLMRQIAEPGDS